MNSIPVSQIFSNLNTTEWVKMDSDYIIPISTIETMYNNCLIERWYNTYDNLADTYEFMISKFLYECNVARNILMAGCFKTSEFQFNETILDDKYTEVTMSWIKPIHAACHILDDDVFMYWRPEKLNESSDILTRKPKIIVSKAITPLREDGGLFKKVTYKLVGYNAKTKYWEFDV